MTSRQRILYQLQLQLPERLEPIQNPKMVSEKLGHSPKLISKELNPILSRPLSDEHGLT